MLVLSRVKDEKIHIGSNITITVVDVRGNRVKLGIEAPGEFLIIRGELVPAQGIEVELDLDEDQGSET